MRRGLSFIGWGMITPNEMGEELPDSPHGFAVGYDHREYWDGSRFLGPDPWGVTPIYEDRRGNRFPAEAEMVRCEICGGPCMPVPAGRSGRKRHHPL